MSTGSSPADGHPAPQMVLVTGAGRSGTSTIAGTLHYLGMHAPEPFLKANKSNPKGFFESWWPVRFHNAILQRAEVEQTDGRPDAVDRVRAEIGEADVAEVDAWVAGLVGEHDLVMVKDPRAVWAPGVWSAAAAAAGAELSFLTMLRHPAEVLGSRQTYYSSGRPWLEQWEFAVLNLCGWINGNLTLERQTRDNARTFILYDDLLGDWRTEIERVREQLGLRIDLSPERVAEVDEFIDPDLRRHAVGWDELEMPSELTELADGVLATLVRLAEAGGHDAEAEARMDELGARYERLYRVSQAIAQDPGAARKARLLGVAEGRRQAEEEARKRAEEQAEAQSARERRSLPARSRRLAGRVARRVPPLRWLRARLLGPR